MAALTGTDIGAALLPLTGLSRELAVLSAVQAALVAPQWCTVRSVASLAGKTRTLEIDVDALPLRVGTASDWLLVPAWPWTYQRVADALGCGLLTRKIALLVAQQAGARIEPHPFSASELTTVDGKTVPANETTARYVASNGVIRTQLAALPGYVPGQLVSGAKKDVVIGPNLDGGKVAIFGWFHAAGPQTDTDAGRWQPYSTVHESTYVDYSHGGRLVRRQGRLDGSPVDLGELMTDKVLWPLVSDQGPMTWRFPNAPKVLAPPAGFPTDPVAPPATGMGSAAGAAALGLVGGVVGGLIGGPPGAVVGTLFGAAIGRAK